MLRNVHQSEMEIYSVTSQFQNNCLLQFLLSLDPDNCVDSQAICKGAEVGDAGFSLCGGLAKTTKSLSAFLSWFISSLLVDG